DENMVFEDDPPLVEECQGTSATRTLATSLPVSIYPNPASGTLQIRCGIQGSYQVTLRDPAGQILYAGANITELEVSHLPRGIALVEIATSEGVAVRKVVLQ
ncbi:MAG: T9SS type A sorting domain-containing protein, partial [Saprospiraceae bacterium]|nr:T9SS type A sorting domain-containing protein [Saprospiraceae bacterium]